MALSREQEDKLRSIYIFHCVRGEENGRPVHSSGRGFIIPRFEEIFKEISSTILESNFCEVKKVSPYDANCIIRVFYERHFWHNDEVYNLYGAECYTRSGNEECWMTTSDSDNDKLKPLGNHCKIQVGLPANDSFTTSCQKFRDFPVKVT